MAPPSLARTACFFFLFHAYAARTQTSIRI